LICFVYFYHCLKYLFKLGLGDVERIGRIYLFAIFRKNTITFKLVKFVNEIEVRGERVREERRVLREITIRRMNEGWKGFLMKF
jgi:hypothetical protein